MLFRPNIQFFQFLYAFSVFGNIPTLPHYLQPLNLPQFEINRMFDVLRITRGTSLSVTRKPGNFARILQNLHLLTTTKKAMKIMQRKRTVTTRSLMHFLGTVA